MPAIQRADERLHGLQSNQDADTRVDGRMHGRTDERTDGGRLDGRMEDGVRLNGRAAGGQ